MEEAGAVILRAATEDDVPAISALERAGFGARAWTAGMIRAELAGVRATRYVIVAAAGDVVVGYAVLMTVSETADVLRVAVTPARRRHGIGRLLIGELLAEAARRGCTTVLLEVGRDDDAAVAFYAALAFSVVNERAGYYGSGRDALIMARTLPGGE